MYRVYGCEVFESRRLLATRIIVTVLSKGVLIRVPDSYFISWDDFPRLHDQLIRFMQTNTLDDPALAPVVCTDGEPPYSRQTVMEQLRAHPDPPPGHQLRGPPPG